MFTRMLSIAVLGVATAAPLLSMGCAADHQPNQLTGEDTISAQEQKERARWTDEKGRYRPDLRARGGPPLRYIP